MNLCEGSSQLIKIWYILKAAVFFGIFDSIIKWTLAYCTIGDYIANSKCNNIYYLISFIGISRMLSKILSYLNF